MALVTIINEEEPNLIDDAPPFFWEEDGEEVEIKSARCPPTTGLALKDPSTPLVV